MLLLTHNPAGTALQTPWNKDKLVGPKPPLKLSEIWAIRIRLAIERRVCDLAMRGGCRRSKCSWLTNPSTIGLVESTVLVNCTNIGSIVASMVKSSWALPILQVHAHRV